MNGMLRLFFIGCCLHTGLSAYGNPPTPSIATNEVSFENPPSWLTVNRVDRAVEKVQRVMEWDIRKVRVQYYPDQIPFQKVHGFDASVLAVSKKPDNSIHLGPRVTAQNFDQVFGHELVHIILFQKYRQAIPQWLEEGLANYVSGHGRVDYQWLSTQSLSDVRALTHPFLNSSGGSNVSSRLHYQASTALIEMIASKCRLTDLLQLSVGEKLESYLATLCGISDINSEFKKWMKRKAPR